MTVRDLTILGCSSQQPTRFRNHGAYLVRWNKEGLLFDPGEGTQRQYIFANIAPPVTTRIFVSHFHGDHCLGLGSMLMRLNLDKVEHPIHCYYPASGKKFFDRLRFGTAYHEVINVVEHPVSEEGVVHDDGRFRIEAKFLDHSIDNVGWRITEPDTRKYHKEKLKEVGLRGPLMRELEQKGSVEVNGQVVHLEDVSWVRRGEVLAVVIDTLPCKAAVELARDASLFLCEATYLETERRLARKHYHLTARQAAEIAHKAKAKKLILTHFSARYRNLNPFVEEAAEIFPNVETADDLKRFAFERQYH